MDPLQAVILALLQGLTEFLPISSSAHLALFPRLATLAPGSLMINPDGRLGGELYRNEIEALARAIGAPSLFRRCETGTPM